MIHQSWAFIPRSLVSLALAMVLALTLGACTETERYREKQEAPPESLLDARQQANRYLDRGLKELEKAYAEDVVRVKISHYDKAMELFKTANDLFLKIYYKVPEPDRAVIDYNLQKIDSYMAKCYRDRPAR